MIKSNVEKIIKGIIQSMVIDSVKESRQALDIQLKSHEKVQNKFSWYYNLKEGDKQLFWDYMEIISIDPIRQLLYLIANSEGGYEAELFDYELLVNGENIGEELSVYFDTVMSKHFPDLHKRYVLGE